MTVLSVSGRIFSVPQSMLRGTLRMCTDDDTIFLRTKPDASGVYHVDRDPHTFETVILPFLRNGGVIPAGTDAFMALRELDYYGLIERPDAAPRGLSIHHATTWCRMMIDRLVLTMGTRPLATMCFFCEDVRFHPLDTSIDLSLFVKTFGELFRSIALTEYQVLLQWDMSKTEVQYCSLAKNFRTTETSDLIYGYVHFRKLESTGTVVFSGYMQAGAPSDFVTCTYTPIRHMVDCRTLGFDIGSCCPIKGRVRVWYDQLQKNTIADIELDHDTEGWTGITSYSLQIYTGDPAVPLFRSAMRIYQHATAMGMKSRRYTDQELWMVISEDTAPPRETFVSTDPFTQRARILTSGRPGATRIITQTRTRHICRLQGVVLSI